MLERGTPRRYMQFVTNGFSEQHQTLVMMNNISTIKSPRGRYAPSPTGFLHLGNARTALAAWLQTRSQGGEFILRIEDLDSQRSKSKYIEANIAELHWLGLDWDEGPEIGGKYAPYIQSQRHNMYHEALGHLQSQRNLFECYLSRKDLQDVASAPHEKQIVYSHRERSLNENIKAQKKLEGKTPSLRFRVESSNFKIY